MQQQLLALALVCLLSVYLMASLTGQAEAFAINIWKHRYPYYGGGGGGGGFYPYWGGYYQGGIGGGYGGLSLGGYGR